MKVKNTLLQLEMHVQKCQIILIMSKLLFQLKYTLKCLFLFVYVDRPKPPTNFYASVIGSTVATFTWTGGFNGGNNQTFIITYWKEHSVIKNYARIPEDNEKDYVFEISMLMPSTTYIFSINATNDEGYSEYVNNTIIVSTKDVPGMYNLFIAFIV